MNRTRLFVTLLSCLFLAHWVNGQSMKSMNAGPANVALQRCRASLTNDTLVIENDRIARRFRWNNGHLITLSLTDKQQPRTWQWVSQDPDCTFTGHTKPTDKGQFETKQIVGQPNQTDHLEVSVTARLGTCVSPLSVGQIF